MQRPWSFFGRLCSVCLRVETHQKRGEESTQARANHIFTTSKSRGGREGRRKRQCPQRPPLLVECWFAEDAGDRTSSHEGAFGTWPPVGLDGGRILQNKIFSDPRSESMWARKKKLHFLPLTHSTSIYFDLTKGRVLFFFSFRLHCSSLPPHSPPFYIYSCHAQHSVLASTCIRARSNRSSEAHSTTRTSRSSRPTLFRG